MKKIILKIIIIIASLISLPTHAADIYGLDDEQTKKIAQKYAPLINKFESGLQQAGKQMQFSKQSTHLEESITQQRLTLIEKMTKENGFLFVDLQTTFFPYDNKFYTSIEIIDKHHPERLRFISLPQNNVPINKPPAHKPDVFDAMIKYEKTGFTLSINHQISSLSAPCPVYHCIVGFEHPQLKPYLSLFNRAATHEKKRIITTLQHDPDPKRRAAAAFLVGHFQNYQEIITVLTPCVADKDEGVRNNVMRVIAETLAKEKTIPINLAPFLEMLDSPYSTDRNKALYVLLNATASKNYRQVMIQQAGGKLLALLQLQLPTNHDSAYRILTIISGKNFSPNAVTTWKAWLSAARKNYADL